MRRLPFPILALLAACSSPPPDPSGLSADEQRQLNAAAADLDVNTANESQAR